MIAWIDGDIVPLDEARVPLTDRGFLVGDGVFETLRTFGSTPFALARHMQRLTAGTALLGLPNRSTVAQTAVRDLASAMDGDLRIRVQVTSGPMEDMAGPGRVSSVTAFARPFVQPPSHPLRTTTSSVTKALHPLSTIKHMSYVGHMHAAREAQAAGVDDCLLQNEAGRWSEASTSNLFAVVDGVVHAPGGPEGALPGVTRALLVEDLQTEGYDVVEALDAADLFAAEEVWITSTSRGVVPICEHDGRALGHAGPVTKLAKKCIEARWDAART